MIQILLIFLLLLNIHQQHHQNLSLPLFLPLPLPLPLLPYSVVYQTQRYLSALNVTFLCTRTRALIPSQLLWIPWGIMREVARTSHRSMQLLDQVNVLFFLLSGNHTDCKLRDQPYKLLNILGQTLHSAVLCSSLLFSSLLLYSYLFYSFLFFSYLLYSSLLFITLHPSFYLSLTPSLSLYLSLYFTFQLSGRSFHRLWYD